MSLIARTPWIATLTAALFNWTTAFAQGGTGGPVETPAAPGAPTGSVWQGPIFIVVMILFMWFFLIRPQAKRQKEHRNFLNSLSVGQEVVTQGGIIGRISSLSDNIVTLDLGSSSIRVLRSAVSGELGKVTPDAASLAKN